MSIHDGAEPRHDTPRDLSRCVAAAVAFLTPVSLSPAGYRFGDYWKLGLPLVALFGVVSVGLVPLVWKF